MFPLNVTQFDVVQHWRRSALRQHPRSGVTWPAPPAWPAVSPGGGVKETGLGLKKNKTNCGHSPFSYWIIHCHRWITEFPFIAARQNSWVEHRTLLQSCISAPQWDSGCKKSSLGCWWLRYHAAKCIPSEMTHEGRGKHLSTLNKESFLCDVNEYMAEWLSVSSVFVRSAAQGRSGGSTSNKWARKKWRGGGADGSGKPSALALRELSEWVISARVRDWTLTSCHAHWLSPKLKFIFIWSSLPICRCCPDGPALFTSLTRRANSRLFLQMRSCIIHQQAVVMPRGGADMYRFLSCALTCSSVSLCHSISCPVSFWNAIICCSQLWNHSKLVNGGNWVCLLCRVRGSRRSRPCRSLVAVAAGKAGL